MAATVFLIKVIEYLLVRFRSAAEEMIEEINSVCNLACLTIVIFLHLCTLME